MPESMLLDKESVIDLMRMPQVSMTMDVQLEVASRLARSSNLSRHIRLAREAQPLKRPAPPTSSLRIRCTSNKEPRLLLSRKPKKMFKVLLLSNVSANSMTFRALWPEM